MSEPSVVSEQVGEVAGSGGARARDHFLLGGDWVERFLPELTPLELRLYLALAAWAEGAAARPLEQILEAAAQGAEGDAGIDAARQALASLRERGFVEIVERGGRSHINLWNADAKGVHRPDRQRNSLAEALEFQDQMVGELADVDGRDETAELRERVFTRYPELRAEFELAESAADEDTPRLRLWMELSRYLMHQFEERFGLVRDAHAHLFREISSRALQERVQIVEQITGELVEARGRLFPESGEGWVVMPGMDEFVRSALVGNLSERYGLGSELLFVSLIEALQQEGYVILSADTDGTIENVLLPATTGLSAEDESVLLAGSRACAGDEAKIEAWLGLRTAYARHLAGRAVETVAEFARRDRVRDIDGLLTQVLDGVNEALDLLEGADEDEGPADVDAPPFTFEEVVEIWDKAKARA